VRDGRLVGGCEGVEGSFFRGLGGEGTHSVVEVRYLGALHVST